MTTEYSTAREKGKLQRAPLEPMTAEARAGWIANKHGLSGEVVLDIAEVTREAHAAGKAEGAAEERRRALTVARQHGDFCHREADNGGSADLRERAKGAFHIAKLIERGEHG